MLNHSEIESFLENGYVIREGALSQADIETYRAAVERVLYKCRVEKVHPHLRYVDGEKDDIWGVNHIFHPNIREGALVESLGHPQILDVIEALIGARLLYHLCTLLVSSERKPYHINWHRDSARDGEIELEQLMARLRSHVQLNGALYDDETLYIVPGSHRRAITDAEREMLRNSPKAGMFQKLLDTFWEWKDGRLEGWVAVAHRAGFLLSFFHSSMQSVNTFFQKFETCSFLPLLSLLSFPSGFIG